MPIYEYRCQSCDTISEKLVRNGNEPTTCPDCGAEGLTRLISKAGIIFKGSGFYVTDSKGSSSSGDTAKSTASESKSESSSSNDSSNNSGSKSESQSTISTKTE